MPGKKVLIIEDNEQNLYLITYLLENSGYEVTPARDGAQGCAMAEVVQPDVILLDIQLPGMDGYAVARALRKKPLVKETPIVAVTSYAMPGDKEKALSAGCTGYIEKPIDPAVFIDQLEEHLV
ncbi:response regulator [Desulfatibacillum aliphaticivorans]|uniref:response regulator n=1 Tax=Desulfatibacillum aliphaticivorans TaxID=218208 RepID=UPI000415F69E|nr:response regulator [Desulfatibacillum aliphaticivorans]